MAINLADFESMACTAVRTFWGNRRTAAAKQNQAGRADRGERAAVTAGNNMDGFIDLMQEVILANGLTLADIQRNQAVLTLPGFFRPTKLWDLLVVHEGELIAAIELKSQVGPSFGNNFNNRAEETIGMAHDFWTAYRKGAFGMQPCPFVGWLILVEDAPKSRAPVRDTSPHFPIFEDFTNTSYLERYDLLCRKLTYERLYTAASLIVSPRNSTAYNDSSSLSSMTSLKTFVATLAGHITAVVARRCEA